jgi:magnesium-transporting ATPase (P-type)
LTGGTQATTSWIFQATLALIFGPLLPIMLYYATPSLRQRLEQLHRQLFFGNAVITLPSLIAAIVYLRQDPALYEVTYIYYLATFQMLVMLGTAISGAIFIWADSPSFKVARDRLGNLGKRNLGIDRADIAEWMKFAFLTLLSCVICFGLYMGTVTWVRNTSVSRENIDLVISACQAYGRIVPNIPVTALAGPAPPLRINPQDVANNHNVVVGACVVGGIVALVLLVLVVMFAAFVLIMLAIALFWAFIAPVPNFLMTLGFSIGMLYCLVRMQENRAVIKSLAGPDFEDDKWGFGQVVAVFVWIPLAFNITVWIIQLLCAEKGQYSFQIAITHDRRLEINTIISISRGAPDYPECACCADPQASIDPISNVFWQKIAAGEPKHCCRR